PASFSGHSIVASSRAQTVWPDQPTTVWTLGGSYPAPTIRLKKGEQFSVMLTNNLEEPTNIHWHGLLVPAEMDGHAMDVVAPGSGKKYEFTIEQRAGIYWYHPHPDGSTGRQVYKGMAGFFIVEDDEEMALGLPSGNYEIPLVIQDRRIRTDRAFDYTLTMPDRMDGRLGDTILANGTPDAMFDAESTIYRFRLLNGSNARVYNIALSDHHDLHVIGTDCGLLDRLRSVQSFFLGPGERVDLLIDLSSYTIGSSVRLVAETFDNAIDWTTQGWGGDILTLNVMKEGPKRTLPTTLVSYEHLDPDNAIRTRSFSFKMVVPMPETGMHTINDLVYDGARVDLTVGAGDTEIWRLFNNSDEPHPIHIHGAQFQILNRDGTGIDDPKDMGWKDTVILWGKQVVEVVVRFSTHTGMFLFHCHNLEHEDDGMMMNYEIMKAESGVGEPSPVDWSREKMELR
ncbi:MAG: multicopper oxidase family protein, partial [Bacteroidota bacterium]